MLAKNAKCTNLVIVLSTSDQDFCELLVSLRIQISTVGQCYQNKLTRTHDLPIKLVFISPLSLYNRLFTTFPKKKVVYHFSILKKQKWYILYRLELIISP